MTTTLPLVSVLLLSISAYLMALQIVTAAKDYQLPAGERQTSYECMCAQFKLYPLIHRVMWLWTRVLSPLIPTDTIQRYNDKLQSAGAPGGLNGAEFLSTAPLLGITFSITGGLLTSIIANQSLTGALVGGVLGTALPFARLDNVIAQRKRAILTGLPYTIDLIALCMRAGQTFYSALTTVNAEMAANHPLRLELAGMAARISLGASTAESLQTLAHRIDCPEVLQFVQSVIRSHHKGSSLADIFSIQANIIRVRRSEAAEQTASRAAVAMLAPLMLIFLSVFVVLLGPFGVKAFYGQLF
ncbi:MAG: type II secretion system F family protein [Deltaproteobacteria bacterium]|nr:type II secretion system F family protein [Deltaproteobacteria bacterium]